MIWTCIIILTFLLIINVLVYVEMKAITSMYNDTFAQLLAEHSLIFGPDTIDNFVKRQADCIAAGNRASKKMQKVKDILESNDA